MSKPVQCVDTAYITEAYKCTDYTYSNSHTVPMMCMQMLVFVYAHYFFCLFLLT